MKLTKVNKDTFKATFKQDISNTSVETQSDKYFYDRQKTIGFRKDKRLFKFVGLRDGYSKQLELTVKSIIIDGEEKIASNRVNFSEISLSGDTVVHNINGIDFFNRIDLSNYKNLVKIEDQFTNLDIIYEVHLKGLKISENSYRLGGKNIFRCNHLGQYFIVDEGNDTVQFIIENPVAMDIEGRSYNILTHELYEEGGKFYYKKTITDNTIVTLPLYVDANITFNAYTYANIQSYANNNDDDTSWTDARNGGGMLFLNAQDNSINSFEYKPSQLFTNWIDFSGGNFYEYTLSDFECDFYYNSGDYVITDWFEVVTGETITVSSYNFDWTMGSSDDPDIIIWESGSTMTGTTYNWSVDGFDTTDHTCSTGTTMVAVSINPRNVGDWFYLYFYNFYVRKQGITATNYYESYIERQFLYFYTSQLYKVAINKMELDFTLASPTSGEYAIQKANTASNTVITTSDFNSYQGTPYATFDAVSGFTSVDLGQSIIDDYVDKTLTKLVIRESDYDYTIDTPTANYIDTLTHNWSYELNVELGLFIVTEPIILDFSLETTGFGVIYSSDSDYDNAYNGTNSPYVVHSSVSGTYNSGATYIYDLSTHDLYRTFLYFDTSVLSIYDRYIIKSAKLVIKNHNYNESITVCEGLQGTVSGLTGSEWTNVGQFYANADGITLDSLFEVEVGGDSIDVSGDTRFVIRNKVYDYEQISGSTSSIDSLNGMNFDETYFQVELEPYLIYGVDYIQVEKGKEIDLYASRNTSDGEIYWGLDSGITNILGSGNTLHINTINYDQGDYIYAAILNISGETISNNVLAIYLDLFTYEFNNLPERNFNVHDVDLDAVYFKYHQCLSGATYAYVRELDDIYEQNVQVSDGEGSGSYNMYNEWDIIDEFFSNSHEVEVVGRLDEMDLNISYKQIEDVYIHEGTRVLLVSTTPTEDDGVYVADFNLKLHKTDELEDADKAFRYKAHVNAGIYLDYEFHTKYYAPDAPPPDPFDFDELDANVYGEDVIDFIMYSEYLFDSNVFS